MGPNPKNGPYGASKSAVNSMTASFSQELAPKIRVNAIAPGPVPTDNFNDSVGVHSEEETKALMKYDEPSFKKTWHSRRYRSSSSIYGFISIRLDYWAMSICRWWNVVSCNLYNYFKYGYQSTPSSAGSPASVSTTI